MLLLLRLSLLLLRLSLKLLPLPPTPRRTGDVVGMEIMTSDAPGDSVAVDLIGVLERRAHVRCGVAGRGIKEVLVDTTDRVKWKKIYVKNMIAFLLLSICLYVSILCSSISSVMVSNVEPEPTAESTEPEPIAESTEPEPTEDPMPGETQISQSPAPAPTPVTLSAPAPTPVTLSAPAPTHLVRKISTDGRCGEPWRGIGNNTMCPGFQCCSAGRWCGGNQSTKSAHCKYSDGPGVWRGYFREFDGRG